jgi:hypothetical protein
MLPKPLPIRDLTTMNPQLLRGQRPFLLRKASRGRRPQSPGNQFRARAQFLEVFPPAIRFRQSPAATGLPQSSSKLRNSHVSLHTLSSKLLAPSNTKTAPDCEETVDDETSLWKYEENQEVILKMAKVDP